MKSLDMTYLEHVKESQEEPALGGKQRLPTGIPHQKDLHRHLRNHEAPRHVILQEAGSVMSSPCCAASDLMEYWGLVESWSTPDLEELVAPWSDVHKRYHYTPAIVWDALLKVM